MPVISVTILSVSLVRTLHQHAPPAIHRNHSSTIDALITVRMVGSHPATSAALAIQAATHASIIHGPAPHALVMESFLRKAPALAIIAWHHAAPVQIL